MTRDDSTEDEVAHLFSYAHAADLLDPKKVEARLRHAAANPIDLGQTYPGLAAPPETTEAATASTPQTIAQPRAKRQATLMGGVGVPQPLANVLNGKNITGTDRLQQPAEVKERIATETSASDSVGVEQVPSRSVIGGGAIPEARDQSTETEHEPEAEPQPAAEEVPVGYVPVAVDHDERIAEAEPDQASFIHAEVEPAGSTHAQGDDDDDHAVVIVTSRFSWLVAGAGAVIVIVFLLAAGPLWLWGSSDTSPTKATLPPQPSPTVKTVRSPDASAASMTSVLTTVSASLAIPPSAAPSLDPSPPRPPIPARKPPVTARKPTPAPPVAPVPSPSSLFPEDPK